ncbi:MAG: hypothetical protein A3J38_02160 [Gammaproteobacteria bacterium RIFCSPHIGHO2_12_FULL_45_9]|nr:MAG: hypothetical protein A3J38_02160 [Gammaproteobacteria bacterium RIFCSPHIGHO2_12_FULL_45_9]
MGEASLLTNNFIIMSYILQKVAVILGLALILSGFFQLKKYGEQRSMMSTQMSAFGPTLMIICGSVLLILPEAIGAAVLAFWGTNNPLSYDGGPSGYSALIPPLLIMVRVVGVGSFIRGVILLAKSGGQHGQPGQTGKAFTYIIAGVFCIHILGTIDLLENIMGLG